ncbi:MAG: beta-N-acetylhexosaminidase [bacterium]
MKRKIIAALLFLTLCTPVVSAPGWINKEKPMPVIPRPVQLTEKSGDFPLRDGAAFVFPGKEDWKRPALVFMEKIEKRHGVKLEAYSPVAASEAESRCGKDEVPVSTGCMPCQSSIISGPPGWCQEQEKKHINFPEAEGYEIKAGPHTVKLTAMSPAGMHNGLMTLLQLVRENERGPELPAVHVLDHPRFQWRGMLLDSARSFLPPDIIKKYIDLLSELKLNVLHWHLVDDQGWRIEVKSLPRLHEGGGVLSNLEDKKKRALDRHGWGSDNRGYYTQEELKEIVEYAEARQVMIVPEIDVPGHTSAMLAAYPELSCSGKEVPLRKGPGIYPTAVCPGKESVYEFLDTLFGELETVFPAPYLHIGSDEVVASDWMEYPPNQDILEKTGYKGREGLQRYFVERVNEILEKHGKTMIAWDEVTHYIPEGAVVQAWRKHKYARVAAEKGHYSVVSPTSHCYIDYPQLTFTLKNLYHFEPIPEGLDRELRHYILGGEVNLWGERVTVDNIDRKAFPRVIGHAEVMWTPPELKDWEHFQSRLKRVKKDMQKRGVGCGVTWRDIFGLL